MMDEPELRLRALSAASSRVKMHSLEVLVDGRPITEYAARGKTYVEAIEGREYTLRLRNHTGERVAVALSVDGLNTIDAKTTPALHARKWILGPYQTVDLSGWQDNPPSAVGQAPGPRGPWQAKNGILTNDRKSEAKEKDLWTQDAYGDFVLTIDWRLPAKPVMKKRPVILPSGAYDMEAGKVKEVDVAEAGSSGIFL